jgi:hypothetical protein
MELDEPSIDFKPVVDRRPVMPEPPPVQLVAVEDVHATCAAGLERKLDDFYVGLLKFEREYTPPDPAHCLIVYKAENFRLVLEVLEPPMARDNMRPIAIGVPSLFLLEKQLIDREIEYGWQKSLNPGGETLFFQDPADNWIQVGLFSKN